MLMTINLEHINLSCLNDNFKICNVLQNTVFLQHLYLNVHVILSYDYELLIIIFCTVVSTWILFTCIWTDELRVNKEIERKKTESGCNIYIGTWNLFWFSLIVNCY